MASSEQQARARVAVLVMESGRTIPLTAPATLTIGRDQGDLQIADDQYLSQLHARIDLRDHSCMLRDCGSTNGTFVQVHGTIELRPGDEIMIGDQLFRVAV
jgi:pSer/pThr/pTyr-binding forkhead associated (FHA) protein